jgi:hypothetical protein
MHLVIEIIVWLAVSILLMSFLEHVIHRNLMHKRTFLSDRFTAFKKMFEHHAVLHHVEYSKIFSDEPVPPKEDRHIRLSMSEGALEALPFCILFAIISIPGAIIFMGIVCTHHFIWNQIHLEMHKPQKRFFSDWPIYKHLARHHYLHHKYPSKNFNVVLPIADYLIAGQAVRASKADLQDMQQLGMF